MPCVFTGVGKEEDARGDDATRRAMPPSRRVRMAVHYQSEWLKPEFRHSTHPRTRAVLRQSVRWPRLTGFAPEFAPATVP
jgi:hypothetical protein